MTATENNVAAQAGDEPMRAVVALAWKWHDEAVADGFAASEPAQELFELLGWPDRAAQVSPCATADVERDAARYQWLRHGDNDELVLQRGPVAPDYVYLPRNAKLDEMIDAHIATTKPGA